MTNPFFNRGPIQDPRYYFPRPRETHDILRLLAGSQNCSVVGPVKSGKTSLLWHLARPGTLATQGLSPAQHHAVYLSFEGLGALSASQFFHLMVRELARQTAGKITLLWPRFEASDALSFLELKETLAQVEVSGERLIFLLDEVELTARNPAFDLNFFSALRHLAARAGICFVTASQRPLHEIEVAGREVGSPFADLFSVVRLRHLDPELACNHAAALAEQAGVDLSSEREWILRLGGGWPYYLQVVAYEVFERKLDAVPLTEEERWYVESRAREQLEPVFSMIWERLEEGRREIALIALDGERLAPEVDGLTTISGGIVRPVNLLAEQFLHQRRQDRSGRIRDYFSAEASDAAIESVTTDRGAIYGVVRGLMRAVEARDRCARGHADQVARLAVEIAKELNCPEEVAEGIRVAARLHDLGYVSISDTILLKPGPLSELETRIVRSHPLVGAQILEALEFPWSVKPAVRYHHERLDGSGYPEGLMGKEIPFSARVLAVADVAAAMMAARPYRHARSKEETLAELVANAGTKYDPEAVRALARVLGSDRH